MHTAPSNSCVTDAEGALDCPLLAAVRAKSSQPRFSLAHASEAIDWLRHPVLGPRFCEITAAAVGHLENRVKPRVLFGSAVDVDKFHECMTLFAVAGEHAAREEPALKEPASLCVRALISLGKGEHPVAARVARAELGAGVST